MVSSQLSGVDLSSATLAAAVYHGQSLAPYLLLLNKVNAGANCVLFAWRYKRIRLALRKMLLCQCCGPTDGPSMASGAREGNQGTITRGPTPGTLTTTTMVMKGCSASPKIHRVSLPIVKSATDLMARKKMDSTPEEAESKEL